MPQPWERYQSPSSATAAAGDGQGGSAPWQKYGAGSAPAATPPASVPTPAAQETTLHKISSGALDLLKGVGEGALSTISSGDDWAAKHLPTWVTTPIGQAATPENQARAIAHTKELARPTNTTQKIGKGAEQTAEFLIPGEGEERAAALAADKLATAAPRLAKIAPTAAKVAASGVGAGMINKLQGGSFEGGAAAGAVGAAGGAVLKKIAPKLAESALNVRGTDRAYGRTPGQAILDETTGVRPGKIAQQASDKVGKLSDDLEDLARDRDEPASLLPAREQAIKSTDSAYGRNNPKTYDKMLAMSKQLGENLDGEEIPEDVSPQRLLHIKRGIGDLQTSWNPATQPKWVNGQVGHVYHALDSELDRVLPEGADINQRISSLMPAAQRAEATDLNAGFVQRSIGRFKAHTGALAPALLAAGYGGAHSGLPGAFLGGGAGLLATEAAAAPETWMGVARAADAPITGKIASTVAPGASLQLPVFVDPEQQPGQPQR